ncbi:hypothetical protein KBA01_24790 [Kozakia baliensis]|nr:hypothetical protein KBA01_24790 [Kozakia baliensis]
MVLPMWEKRQKERSKQVRCALGRTEAMAQAWGEREGKAWSEAPLPRADSPLYAPERYY